MKTKNSLFEMFKLLNGRECKMSDVISILGISEATFHKNILKIKDAGFKVSYRNSLYRIDVFKNEFNLNETDKETFAYLLKISDELSKNKQKSFISFIDKFLFLANEKDYTDVIKKYKILKKAALYDEFREKIKIIKQNFQKKMKIILNSGTEISARILKLSIVKDKIYLCIENNKTLREEKIPVEKIAKIVPNRNLLFDEENKEVIFEISSNLAKTYLLKEDERVIEGSKNKLVVASYTKDKNTLFKRLLRYDTMCKVLYPKYDVEKFKEIISKSLENLEKM